MALKKRGNTNRGRKADRWKKEKERLSLLSWSSFSPHSSSLFSPSSLLHYSSPLFSPLFCLSLLSFSSLFSQLSIYNRSFSQFNSTLPLLTLELPIGTICHHGLYAFLCIHACLPTPPRGSSSALDRTNSNSRRWTHGDECHVTPSHSGSQSWKCSSRALKKSKSILSVSASKLVRVYKWPIR